MSCGIGMVSATASAMKRSLIPLAIVACLVSSCEKATPEKTFTTAVLNCNLLHGFAGNVMERRLSEPGVKLANPGSTDAIPMTRKEDMNILIQTVEEAYEKIKKLPETEDTKEMLKASRAVFDFTLPVLKGEYMELARLYDEGGTRKEIDFMQLTIRSKYQKEFEARMEALTAVAKPYAAKNNIKVQWDVRTSP